MRKSDHSVTFSVCDDTCVVNSAKKQLWEKELVYQGVFYPAKDIPFEVDYSDLQNYFRQFYEMKKDGIEVPIYLGHQNEWSDEAPTKRVGTLTDVVLQLDSKKRPALFGKLSLTDPNLTFSQVSIFSPHRFRAGNNVTYNNAITHVAVTDRPVVSDLDAYIALSLPSATKELLTEVSTLLLLDNAALIETIEDLVGAIIAKYNIHQGQTVDGQPGENFDTDPQNPNNQVTNPDKANDGKVGQEDKHQQPAGPQQQQARSKPPIEQKQGGQTEPELNTPNQTELKQKPKETKMSLTNEELIAGLKAKFSLKEDCTNEELKCALDETIEKKETEEENKKDDSVALSLATSQAKELGSLRKEMIDQTISLALTNGVIAKEQADALTKKAGTDETSYREVKFALNTLMESAKGQSAGIAPLNRNANIKDKAAQVDAYIQANNPFHLQEGQKPNIY